MTLTSTNLTLPLSQWTPVRTNILNVDGNFSIIITNAVNAGATQGFYTLQMQD